MRPALARWLIVLAVVSLVAAACNPARRDGGAGGAGSPAPAGSVDPKTLSGTLNVWFFGVDNPTAQARVRVFEQNYPNVKLQFTPGGFDAQKFLTAVNGGDPPDVVHMGRADVPAYAARGALQPIDDYIKASGFDMSVFYDAPLKQVQLSGKTYGFPQFNNIPLAYINNKALEDAGLTPDDVDFSDWERLAEVNRKLTKVEGNNVVRVGITPKLPDALSLWAALNGASLLSEDGSQSQLESPEVAEALRFAASLYEPVGGKSKYDAFTGTWAGGDQKGNPIDADLVGIFIEEQWYLGSLGQSSPDYDITLKPLTSRRDGREVTLANGNAMVMPRGVKNAQLSFEFMKFMSSEEQWVEAAKAAKANRESKGQIYTGTFSANKNADRRIFSEVYEPSGKKAYDEGVQLVLSLQEKATYVPPTPAWPEVLAAYTEAANRVLTGKAEVDEALRSADEKAQKAIDEAKAS